MYASREHVENYLLTDIDTSFDSQLESWIAAITEFINNDTGRKFEAGGASSSHLYECNGGANLAIDECVEITGVEIGDRCVSLG